VKATHLATRRLGAARLAVGVLFFANGFVNATWLARMPAVKAHAHLSDGGLGLALLAGPAGAVLMMQFGGRLSARYGSRPLARAGISVFPLVLVGPALASGLWTLAVARFIYGAVNGVLDMSMNAQGVAVERAFSRPVMSGLHAAWSVGALFGAITAAGAVGLGAPLLAHFAVVGGVVAVGGAVASAALLPADEDRVGADRARRRRSSWRAGWTRRVLLVGIGGAACLMAEGAAEHWSAIFAHDVRGASQAVGSLTYSAFAAALMAVRLVGDRVRVRAGPVTIVRASVAVAASGLAVALVGTGVPAAIIGFALFGAGLALVLPLMFSAAGHEGAADGSAGEALARFTTMTYAGALAGPPLVGLLADAAGLTFALAVLGICLLAIALSSHAVTAAELRRPDPAPAVPVAGLDS
jgi:MFS family permease